MISFQVTFKECDTFDLRVLKGPSDYMAAANSSETTEKIEACMKVWIKQIEQVRHMGHVELSSVIFRPETFSISVCFTALGFEVKCLNASSFRSDKTSAKNLKSLTMVASILL